VPLITDALDAVINNAGVLPEGERFGELDARVLESTFATNTVGPLLVTQALLPFLRKGQSPRVMSISSILGSIGAREGFYTPSYCISKAALNMGARLMSFELAKLGVIAFVVHPGWVKTEMGGAGAQVEVADAAAGLLRVLDGATAASSEAMQTYDGGTLPW
jgi:NAD(P)-dependent dehydrogenase (short-subunit alcohol dehydrogenase family)